MIKRFCHYLTSARETSRVACLNHAPIATLGSLPIGICTIEQGIEMLDPFQDPSRDHRFTRNIGTNGIAMVLRLNGF